MNKAFYAVLLKWLEPGEFKEIVGKRITAEEWAQKCLLMNKLKDLHYWKISWLIMKQRKQRALCVIRLKMDLLDGKWESRVNKPVLKSSMKSKCRLENILEQYFCLLNLTGFSLQFMHPSWLILSLTAPMLCLALLFLVFFRAVVSWLNLHSSLNDIYIFIFKLSL